jgi:peptide/nickel transport system substrate-binding protein
LTDASRTRARLWAGGALIVALVGWGAYAWLARRQPSPPPPAPRQETPVSLHGGSLIGSIRAEPRGFNRYTGVGATLEAITFLTQAKLVRINRSTDQVEPWLAESWTATPSGLSYVLKLRAGIAFSDGAPFTADDVVFAFRAVSDPKTASPLADSLRIAGRPLAARAVDPNTVEITFPAQFGPGLRILDNLPILPRHKLEAALNAGTLASAWGPTTAPEEMAGMGPFVLSEYRPGERLIFTRNPRYWRKDPTGQPLPYLDSLTLEILPDQNAELLRLVAGQLDFTQSEIRSEDFGTLRRAEQEHKVRLFDLGVGLDADAFWFNLAPPKRGGEKPAKAGGDWLRREEFREAISLAVDRRAFCNTVFLGAAVPVHGPVTSGNPRWYVPDLPGGAHDLDRARTLLAGLGMSDRNGNGQLEDEAGKPVQFTILVQRGIAAAERGAAFIRDELRVVGVSVDIVGLEAGAVQERWQSGNYDAIYQRLLTTDTDPAVNLDYWLSSGSAHVWNPGQAKPATPWEAQIDDLMQKQVSSFDSVERVRLFSQAQRIFAEHMPALYFAAPQLYVAVSARVVRATPSRLRPPLLWNPEELATVPPAATTD